MWLTNKVLSQKLSQSICMDIIEVLNIEAFSITLKSIIIFQKISARERERERD